MSSSVLNSFINNRLSGGVNASVANSLVEELAKGFDPNSGVTTFVNSETGESSSYSAAGLLDNLRSIFDAQENLKDENRAILDKSLTQLGKAFEVQERSAIKYSKDIANATSAVLDELKDEVLRSGKDLSSELRTLKGLVKQAEIEATDNKTKKIDPKLYQQTLSKLITRNKKDISQVALTKAMEDNKEFGLEVEAFSVMRKLPDVKSSIANLNYDNPESKSEQLESFQEGDFTALKDGEREEVIDILKEVQKSYQSNIEKGIDSKQALANANSQILAKVGNLKDSQKTYMTYLSSKYTELKSTESSREFLEALKQNLPGLLVPSMIGALIAAVLGFSGTAGVVSAITVSLIGRMGQDDDAKQIPPQPDNGGKTINIGRAA